MNGYLKKGVLMHRYIRFLAIGIMVLLGVTAAQADKDYRGKWWRIPQVAETLKLSENETRQLEAAFDTALVNMLEAKSKVEVEQVKLRMLMEENDLDRAAVLEQHRRQEEARTRLAEARFAFLLEVRQIVGRDRFQKIMEMREERKRERKLERSHGNPE